jgi:hypothetical protein
VTVDPTATPILDRVPADRPLVVGVSRRYRLRRLLPTFLAAALLLPMGALFVLPVVLLDGPVGLLAIPAVVAVVSLVLVVAGVRAWRRASAGPVLAADHSGVWLRLDFDYRRQLVRYLPWREVAAVVVRRLPRGIAGQASYLCVQAPAPAVALLADPRAARVTTAGRNLFDTPFVVTAARMETDFAALLRELERYAGPGVVQP